MNKFIFIIFISLWVLAHTAYAKVAPLPETLNGKTFVFHVATMHDKNNPNANELYIMHFNDTTYTYEAIDSQKIITGAYHYKRLDPSNEIALITCQEKYHDKMTNYTLLLNAENDKRGLYIYRQTSGEAPQKRLNFAYYTILGDL